MERFKVFDLIEVQRRKWSDLPKSVLEMYERGDIVFLAHSILINSPTGKYEIDRDHFLVITSLGAYPLSSDDAEWIDKHQNYFKVPDPEIEKLISKYRYVELKRPLF